jgi:outer membrane cobalamin receptor
LIIVFSLFIFPSLFSEESRTKDESPSSDEDVEKIELDEVVVTATRTKEELLNVPEHVTIITEDEIKDSGASSINELLIKKTGVHITSYGADGAQKSVSIRGSSSSQVLILVDGCRINNSQSGGADLSLIPLENIERIEIVRGSMSSLYGADAVGGVINIITKKETDKDKNYNFDLVIENGSYIPLKHVKGFGLNKDQYKPSLLSLIDKQRLLFSYLQKIKGVFLNLSGTFVHAENRFIFKDTNNENRMRENAGLLGGDGFISLLVPWKSGQFFLSGFYLFHDKGIPGSSTSPTLSASQRDQNVIINLQLHSDRFFSEYLSFDFKSSFSYSIIEYQDPSQSMDSEHRIISTGVDLFQEAFPFNHVSFVYGGNFNFDYIKSTDIKEQKRFYGGGFFELPIYFTGRFTLTPSVRYDYYSDFKGSFNFKVGCVFKISETASFKSSIARSYRAPTFNDLYWPEDPWAEGNPDLKPETGYSFDLGFTKIGEKIQFDIYGFVRYIKDYILWMPGEDNIWRPSNWGKALYPGLETQLTFYFLKYFTSGINYTFLYTFVLTSDYKLKDNKRIPFIPMHSVNIFFSFKGEKNYFSIEGYFNSLRYLRASNSAYLPSYIIFNLHYKRFLSKKLTLFIKIENLFNEQYEVMVGYPMPGTLIKTGMEVHF